MSVGRKASIRPIQPPRASNDGVNSDDEVEVMWTADGDADDGLGLGLSGGVPFSPDTVRRAAAPPPQRDGDESHPHASAGSVRAAIAEAGRAL